MILLSGISKGYRMGDVHLPVLKKVNLAVNRGEFVAIMGPSGSGKSTLLHIIGCLDTAESGSYLLDGREVKGAPDRELARIRNDCIGFVFQSFNLIGTISAARNVGLPLLYAGIAPGRRRRLAEEALAEVGLGDRSDHMPAHLSGGQRQRVAIARALINRPDVIIADEPTGSLDSATGGEIMEIFSRLHAGGKTIIMVTHEPEIADFVGRVIRLKYGRVVGDRER